MIAEDEDQKKNFKNRLMDYVLFYMNIGLHRI